MEREEVMKEVLICASEVFGVAVESLSETSCALNVDTWSSLNFMILLEKTQAKFNIRLSLTELLAIDSLGALAQVVTNHLS